MMSLTYNGETFTSRGFPRLRRIDGLLGWESTIDASPLAGTDGGVPLAGWVEPRDFRVILQTIPTDAHPLWDQETRIRRAFPRTNDEAPMTIAFPDRPEVVVFCRPSSVAPSLTVVPTDVPVRFVASDPALYSTLLRSTVVPVFVGSGGLMYDVDYPKDYGAAGEGLSTVAPNEGDWPTWPRITITGPSSGTVQPIALENLTDGTEIRFTAGGGLTIPAGSTLVVDTHPARRVVRFADGANRWNTVAGTEWWPINPGGADLRFRATGNIDGVTVTVETRDAWM